MICSGDSDMSKYGYATMLEKIKKRGYNPNKFWVLVAESKSEKHSCKSQPRKRHFPCVLLCQGSVHPVFSSS